MSLCDGWCVTDDVQYLEPLEDLSNVWRSYDSVSSGAAVAHAAHALPVVHMLWLIWGSAVNLLKTIFEASRSKPFSFYVFHYYNVDPLILASGSIETL